MDPILRAKVHDRLQGREARSPAREGACARRIENLEAARALFVAVPSRQVLLAIENVHLRFAYPGVSHGLSERLTVGRKLPRFRRGFARCG
jgi:hypothetical protein